MMLTDLQVRPPDPLLKLIAAYREDPRAEKIDLGVGVYRDEHGVTAVLSAVKEAERRLISSQTSKTYLGQQGNIEFLRLLGELVFGATASELVAQQAVGGTGALRLGCDLLKAAGARKILLPTPSWPNHPGIVSAAGLEMQAVPFFDVAEQRIDMDPLLAAIEVAAPGDGILVQGVCHNPLGADFTPSQWRQLADAASNKGIVPFVDVAYVGFGDGIEEDVAGVRYFLEHVQQAIIAVSGAKTFALYRERVGALFVKAPEASRHAVATNLAAIARTNYSMPPDHGAACVREVLVDPELRESWRSELDAIRSDVKRKRVALAAARINSLPMQLIAGQKGMFSTLPLSQQQVDRLRLEFGIYMTDSARINVAGLRMSDIPRFVSALNAVAA